MVAVPTIQYPQTTAPCSKVASFLGLAHIIILSSTILAMVFFQARLVFTLKGVITTPYLITDAIIPMLISLLCMGIIMRSVRMTASKVTSTYT